jgi:hypothetical protein
LWFCCLALLLTGCAAANPPAMRAVQPPVAAAAVAAPLGPPQLTERPPRRPLSRVPIDQCYRAARSRNPALQGREVYVLEVAPSGDVVGARALSKSPGAAAWLRDKPVMHDSALEHCVLSYLLQTSVVHDGGDAIEIRFALEFMPGR